MASDDERLTYEIQVLDGIVSLLDSIQDEAVESRRASESEVFGPDWVIYSPNESALSGDGAGFWSEADGWTTIGEADHFDDIEMKGMHLPVSTGSDAKWVPWSEAEKHYGGFAEDQLHKAGIDTLSPAIDHLRQND